MKLSTFPSQYDHNGFFRKPWKWKYLITTGPRCSGLESCKEYSSVESAIKAGERMIKKLEGAK